MLHKTAKIFYVNKISIMHFHNLRRFTLFAPTKQKLVGVCVGLCFTVFVPAVMLSQLQLQWLMKSR